MTDGDEIVNMIGVVEDKLDDELQEAPISIRKLHHSFIFLGREDYRAALRQDPRAGADAHC